MVDSSPVPAEGPPAPLASEPTAFPPASPVEPISNDNCGTGVGSKRTGLVGTSQELHGIEVSSAVMQTSKLSTNSSDLNRIELVHQHQIAEAPI